MWKKLAELYASFGAFYSPGELKREFRRLEQKEKAALGGKDAEPDLRKVFAKLYLQKNACCDDAQAKLTSDAALPQRGSYALKLFLYMRPRFLRVPMYLQRTFP